MTSEVTPNEDVTTYAGSPSKLFIGGLSWGTDEEKLKAYFSSYGEIVDVVVMRERATGQHRGFGFVTFKDSDAAASACKETHSIDGRTIDAKPSIPQVEGQKPRSRKVFVGGLAADLTEEQFKLHFEQYGAVSECSIMMDHSTGRSRGFGFITFEEDDSVAHLMQTGSMHMLGSKQVEVKCATPKSLSNTALVSSNSQPNRLSPRSSSSQFQHQHYPQQHPAIYLATYPGAAGSQQQQQGPTAGSTGAGSGRPWPGGGVRPVATATATAAAAASVPVGSGRQQIADSLGTKMDMNVGSGSGYDAAYIRGARRHQQQQQQQQQGYNVNMGRIGAYGFNMPMNPYAGFGMPYGGFPGMMMGHGYPPFVYGAHHPYGAYMPQPSAIHQGHMPHRHMATSYGQKQSLSSN
ncbi:hypothetical protein CEUSTIGMA_g7855.t1 [Chlamydomonas eustigma]|uniref:RRM domain-containing protein n=1 Tax=Chlamydomonas eustigma TaxID=1157962 RepID=A0A250XBI1_9CHLO|nr:hypothetical protein CEUSTIGMA_g7855.t1 [Chlamydomonas eustigma]|eukprot:GAX80416.1 hypothetical protein CEUSTIGMA_g7855.t1 [Chlamydomonas eustigma]